MIPDESQPAEDGVIFVKSADGSPPDPTFEKVMCCTFGDNPTEHHVRIHGGDTIAIIREGLKRLHPGKNPGKLVIEGGEMDDDDAVGERMSRTGKSRYVVNWKMAKECQKFWLWNRLTWMFTMGSHRFSPSGPVLRVPPLHLFFV
jgi:hypothetical protein